MMTSDLDWDLLRYFLAAMRTRSFRKAASTVGASHPTVRRRLLALEAQLGLRLFDRGSEQFQPTADALALFEKAEAVETTMHAFRRTADNADSNLEGEIHVSVPDLLMSEVLAEDVAAFQAQYPQITLHINATYDLANLVNREADVAIRMVGRDATPGQDLLGVKVATVSAAVYGQGKVWLGWEDLPQQEEWIRNTPFADYPISSVVNHVYVQRALCKAGMGLALLPCFMADGLLERRTEPTLVSDIWLLIHPDLRQNPRLRLFRDEMTKALKRRKAQLEGTVDIPSKN